MFRKILVAHDGSPGAYKAMAVAIDLARHYGAEIQVISVIEDLPRYAATFDEVDEVQAEATRHYEAIQAEACPLPERTWTCASSNALLIDSVCHRNYSVNTP